MASNQKLDFSAAVDLLRDAQRLLLVSHEFTDGDDLGGMLATNLALSALGKKSSAIAYGGVADNLLFLPGVLGVSAGMPNESFDTMVYFGCAEPGRTGLSGLDHENKKILNIDHHPDNKKFGTVNLVDSKAAATCEIVYHLIKFLKVEITKSIAVCLLTGIFNDTGGFRHTNTTPGILEIAAELLRKGARIDRISDYYFGKSELSKLRAWAAALENVRFDATQQIVYSIVTEEELAGVGAKPEDLEGVASVLNTIPEAKFSMLLKQRGDEIKGSLRTENYKGVDVAAIARTLGGGGHKLAAGFKLKGKIEKTKDGWKIT